MTPETIKLGLLILAMAPLLVANLRSGNVPNFLVGLLLACGIAIAVTGPSFGTESFSSISLLWWAVGAVLLLAAAIFRMVSAGVAKFLIALMPWYGLEQYLIVFTLGMFLAVAMGKFGGSSRVLIAPPIMSAALCVGIWDAITG